MNTKKTTKKVRFEESVNQEREKQIEVVRKEKQRKRNRVYGNCRSETSKSRGIPANRIALFNGILRDRVHRMECCH